jgi:hypothetical protein
VASAGEVLHEPSEVRERDYAEVSRVVRARKIRSARVGTRRIVRDEPREIRAGNARIRAPVVNRTATSGALVIRAASRDRETGRETRTSSLNHDALYDSVHARVTTASRRLLAERGRQIRNYVQHDGGRG